MTKSKWIAAFILAVTLASASGSWAHSQITTGVIQGTVVDPSGAVVSDARVEAKNLETNVATTLETDSNGRFVFLQLAPGRYIVTVAKQGFATLVQENLQLTVGQTVSLN